MYRRSLTAMVVLAALVTAPFGPALAEDGRLAVEDGVIRYVPERAEDGEFVLANPSQVVVVHVRAWHQDGGKVTVYLSNRQKLEMELDSMPDARSLAEAIGAALR